MIINPQTNGTMKDYYLTFGQDHTHRVNGYTYDCNVVCVIRAENHGAARTIAFDTFDDKFATTYESAPNMEYFSRGLHKLN